MIENERKSKGRERRIKIKRACCIAFSRGSNAYGKLTAGICNKMKKMFAWDSVDRALIFVVTLSLLALRTDTAAQYVKNFDDFKIKEKKNPIPAVTRDLQFNVDYINNPCLLAPTAEVAPLMAIDELQRQYKVFYR